ncbi:MAG: CopD family protein [Ardenticatenia bacterium]|nr:CopD family protein [Ardenticatenia bacterium]
MRLLYLISVWLHILMAVIWLGGILFLVLVLVPVTRRWGDRRRTARFIHEVGEQFRWIGWVGFGMLLMSGLFNLAYRGYGWADVVSGRLWQGPFGRALAIKLALFGVVVVLSALHDFVIGPRTTRLWEEHPDDPQVARLRRQSRWIGRINLMLALLIVWMAIFMVRGWP